MCCCWNRTRSVPPPTPHDTRAACQRGTGPSNLSDSRLGCRSVSRESTVRSPGRYVDARAHIYVLTPRTPRLLHCRPSPLRAPCRAPRGGLRCIVSSASRVARQLTRRGNGYTLRVQGEFIRSRVGGLPDIAATGPRCRARTVRGGRYALWYRRRRRRRASPRISFPDST